MATHATCLWTTATVRAHVGITDAGDTTKDAILERIANGVTAFMERYTRRMFVTRSRTETRDGDGSKILFLDYFPVTALTSVKIVRSPEGTQETVAASSYTQNLDIGKVYLHSDVLNKGVGNVEVVYSTGYGAQGATTLPLDINEIGLQLVKMLFTEETVGAAGQSSITIGAHTISINPSWPKQIKDTLEHWRRAY